jgi:hypothetical protein
MGGSLAHRGPDGEGSYEDQPHRFFMGMRRLSIIDLKGGWQPMYNEDCSWISQRGSGFLAPCRAHDGVEREGEYLLHRLQLSG